MIAAKKNTLILLTLVTLTGLTPVVWAANKRDEKKPVPAKTETNSLSIFIMPTNPSQGRDPFFPESTRVYDQMLANSKTNQVVKLPPLTVFGISGTPGHLLAIINNHTFAAGDTGEVLTPAGDKVQIHCLEVEMNYVLVEVNGHKHRINMGKNLGDQ